MYRELTRQAKMHRRVNRIVAVFAVCLVLAALLFAGVRAQGSLQDQAAASIKATILDTAMQCAAIEGSYPMTLSYLEDNYGLQVNDDDFVIFYDAFASNVLPFVTVVPK